MATTSLTSPSMLLNHLLSRFSRHAESAEPRTVLDPVPGLLIWKLELSTILVTYPLLYAGSVFKSVWRSSPEEWHQPQLADKYKLLRSVIALSNKTLEKAREAKAIRGSLEGQVTIHTDSGSILDALTELTESQTGTDIEFPLCDCLGVSEATIQGGLAEEVHQDSTRFFEEDTISRVRREDARVQIVVAPVSATTGRSKCPRCWKWVCEEKEELCPRCKQVEQSKHEVSI